MNVTSIAKDNVIYFENLVPEGALNDENLLWLGAVAADGRGSDRSVYCF